MTATLRANLAGVDADAFDLEQARDADENRRVRIAFHPDSRHTHWTFKFHGGRGSRRARDIDLFKGKSIDVDIKRARAWLGWFTVPHDIEGERNETKVREMNEFFAIERARTLLTFGDYPRPRKYGDGIDPIGPHRMPDFVATVIEADGSEWEPIRLHELYKIGEFDPLQFTDPDAVLTAKYEETVAENDMLKKMLAEMQGQIKGIAAMVKAGAAKGE